MVPDQQVVGYERASRRQEEEENYGSKEGLHQGDEIRIRLKLCLVWSESGSSPRSSFFERPSLIHSLSQFQIAVWQCGYVRTLASLSNRTGWVGQWGLFTLLINICNLYLL